ncbi:MAG: retropepsin-like aspartic protease family protein [Flavobacterium sp.]|jgi:aspartyl protease family protein|uniref:retropepsin-like aspartic protease family protein n=1 Tax=Flavobacterium sp. TaxID=239 RepID=UPI003BA54D9B
MTRQLCILIISISLLSCNHPEGKKYERNQGSKKEYNSGSDEINVNAVKTENQTNNSVSNHNVLEMEFENGVRYVWIEINGIRLRFIFDTGASSICISQAEATVLYRQGTLQKEDILNIEYFQDATGKISEGTKVNLREVKIGNMILENVEALVIDNVNAPLLLGQTVLERFGSIEIDNVKGKIIFK